MMHITLSPTTRAFFLGKAIIPIDKTAPPRKTVQTSDDGILYSEPIATPTIKLQSKIEIKRGAMLKA